MGIGAAMVFPSTLSLLTNVFTERGERARAIGLWGATTGAAIALGPIVGGWLLELSDWRSIFFAMAPIAALAGVAGRPLRPDLARPARAAIDRAGFALSTATIGAARLHDHRGARATAGERADARRLRADRRCWRRRSWPGSAALGSRCWT